MTHQHPPKPTQSYKPDYSNNEGIYTGSQINQNPYLPSQTFTPTSQPQTTNEKKYEYEGELYDLEMVLNFKTTIEASIKTTQYSIKNYQTEKEKNTQIKPQQQRDEKTTHLKEHKTKLTNTKKQTKPNPRTKNGN
ncbi:hypothetical protein ['Catharanthus roseus' aster yellows phytoplasma]|uniref:Uncharacterized protein n=1 Tax='Catharanthus roseus' aster yellows phytoplasma TaxID=1193712 RepID=A0A4P6M8I8_9MOLU|nr:hypothetical protein ['Catharanthus roseus' aster yellows phytoplasma]QBF23689.1 hypothetical protein EXT02_00395 ['Catharanthus roseus' aster yellows phytoplasma]